MSKLRGMEEDEAREEQFGPLLESLCRWRKAGDLLQLVGEWLEGSVVVPPPSPPPQRDSLPEVSPSCAEGGGINTVSTHV